MKILMVNDYKENIGGTETYIYGIMNQLKKHGHEISLFTSDVTSQEYFSQNYNKSFSKYVMRMFNVSYFWKFRKVVADFKPDIIHIHNIYNEITPSILFFLNHTRVIMTVHGSQMISPVSLQTDRTGRPCKRAVCVGCPNCIGWKGTIYELLKRNIYRILLKKINLYITPSDYLKDVLEQQHYTPVTRIYNGIKLFSYEKIIYTNKILYAGRITPEKGIQVLVDAFTNVVKKISDVQLVIVGKGVLKTVMEHKVAQKKLAKNVSFAETINPESMKSFYTDATIVVIPSIYPDNLPTVGLEALSVGRPLIGTHIGGIPEIIRHNKTGVIVDPGNVNQLTTAIITLLSEKKTLEKMSKNARKYAEENFDIKNHITKLLEQYKYVTMANL